MKGIRHGEEGPTRPRLCDVLFVTTALLLLPASLKAQELYLPRNNYGAVGLIDMPSARMAPDGELSVGAFFTQNTQRYSLGFQALPWLEASFRYSGLQQFHSQYPVYFDRSFAMKARLWNESDWLPVVAIGINDLVGTGVYGGEYIVASKNFGAVDATLGLGWGRLGSAAHFRNPLSLLSSSFDVRTIAGNAGGTDFGALFHGRNTALFGGLTWSTPVQGLSIAGEYSSDAYHQEAATGAFRPNGQFNIGASYQISDGIQVNVSWLYGHSIAGSLYILTDPVRYGSPEKIGPPPPEPRTRSADEQQASLRTLLEERNRTGLRPIAFGRKGATEAELVDAIWRGNAISGVSVDGQVLLLALAEGDLQATCRNTAQIVARHASDITQIRVSAGNQTVACAVPSPALVAPAPLASGSFNTPKNLIPAQEPLVIDAAGRSTSGYRRAETKIRADAAAQSITVVAISLDMGEATIYYYNSRYFAETDALDRLARLLMADAPSEIERFRLIATSAGAPVREYTLLRAQLERQYIQAGALNTGQNVQAAPAPMDNPILATSSRGSYPHFSWGVFPQIRQALFDPNNPLGVQLLAAARGTLEILPGLSASGQAEVSLLDTFEVNRPSDSVLPHVRTDFVQYFTQGKNGIPNLELDYRFRLSPTLFGIARGGYLEGMFAGVGGEILYRPEGARWAMGGDLFAVRQRNFDRLFGFQSFEMITGHLSLYYKSPWYGLNFNFRIGRYLAGDYGTTVEITRRFSTGVEIGAFVTKTNVTAAQFGEGSFDKGIMIRIPLSWMVPLETQAEFGMDLRAVQRDGGQRLSGDTILYEETRRQYEDTLASPRNW